MGTLVDWVRLFAQRRIQSVYFSYEAVVGRIARNDIDLVGIALDAVRDGFSKGAVIATELVIPSAGVVLGAEVRFPKVRTPVSRNSEYSALMEVDEIIKISKGMLISSDYFIDYSDQMLAPWVNEEELETIANHLTDKAK